MNEEKRKEIREVSTNEIQVRFREVVASIGEGNEYVITRHGKRVARMSPPGRIRISEIDNWMSSRQARANLGRLVFLCEHKDVTTMVMNKGKPAFLILSLGE